MIIPPKWLFDEIRNSDFVARAVTAHDGTSANPNLVIKASSLTLKFIVARHSMPLFVYHSSHDGRTVYVVGVDEGNAKLTLIWSPVECDDERDALQEMLTRGACRIELFNELNINVCHVLATIVPERASSLEPQQVRLVDDQPSKELTDEATRVMAALDGSGVTGVPVVRFTMTPTGSWEELHSHYITNRLEPSEISPLTSNEGDQQEALGLWLIDELHPSGAVQNPWLKGERPKDDRELSDLLMSYSGGVFVFESKALSILSRPSLPNREQLIKATKKHSEKALRQLAGACRSLRSGQTVVDSSGRVVEIERPFGTHCIILVSDLGLLEDCPEFGSICVEKFAEANVAFLQWLDPGELYTLVGSSYYLSRLGKVTSPMMAFDALLYERWTRARTAETPNFAFQVRVLDGAPPMPDRP